MAKLNSLKNYIHSGKKLSLNNFIFRIFLELMLVASAGSIVGNVITNFPMEANIKWLAAILLCFVGLSLLQRGSKFVEPYKFVIFAAALLVVIIPSWFYGGGDNTITILYFLLLVIEAFLMLENKILRWIMTVATTLSCITLVTITYNFPLMIQPTESSQNVYLDSLIQIGIVFSILTVSISIYTNRYREQNKKLIMFNNDLEFLASTDALSCTFNKRKILDVLRDAYDDKNVASLHVVMLDIDCFKNINDEYGHIQGDIAIRHLANHLIDIVGRNGFVGRYGGDEFILVLCNMGDIAVNEMAERMLNIIPLDGMELHISAGVTKRIDQLDIDSLVNDADLLLLKAKRNGKNRFELWEQTE